MIIFAIILAGAYLLLLLYYLTGWLKLKTFVPQSKIAKQKFSIVIPVRNEEENIQNLLLDLSRQNYPTDLFEIIVVDDHSEDKTAELVNTLMREEGFSNVRLGKLSEYEIGGKGKKVAITYGVGNSNNDWIICTDADCRMDSAWLSTIAAFAEKNSAVFISAPVIFHEEVSFFQKMQSLEFLSLIGIGAATISHGKPTMCNGANMAFSKEAFNEVGGYTGNEHIASGDDEFLMHKIAKRYKNGVRFLKSQEALVRTQAQSSFKSFWNQRKRWVSKSSGSSSQVERAMQLFVWLFHVAILISLAISFFIPDYWVICIILFATKILSELVFIIPLSPFFSKQKFLIYYIPSAFLYIFYVVFVAISGINNKTSWKGRRI